MSRTFLKAFDKFLQEKGQKRFQDWSAEDREEVENVTNELELEFKKIENNLDSKDSHKQEPMAKPNVKALFNGTGIDTDKLVVLGFFKGTCVTFDSLVSKGAFMVYLDKSIETIGLDDVEAVYDSSVDFEETINDVVDGGVIDADTYEKVAKIYGITEENWILLWFCNIRLLMKAGRIEDNDDFGFVFMTDKMFKETKASVKQKQQEERDLAEHIERIKRNEIERAEREKRELEEQEDHAEYLRLVLEREVAEQEHKDKLAKAEEKRKADKIKAKAKAKSKEASKRNIPPFPPNMKERGKQDSTMVCNKKAQLDWMKKHVPNWDGVLWNKKQANKYIDDIKKGIDVIVCDRIPIAEGFAVYNDECEGLVQAEASTFDCVNL
jgi:hypothetical protein